MKDSPITGNNGSAGAFGRDIADLYPRAIFTKSFGASTRGESDKKEQIRVWPDAIGLNSGK